MTTSSPPRSPLRRPLAGLAAALFAAAPLAGCGGPPARPHSGPDAAPRGLPSFELVATAELPDGLEVDGAPVGGLSALAYQPSSGVWYALSDDRAEHGPARFYALRVELAEGTGAGLAVEVVEATGLRREDGRPFEQGSLDPEGLAVGDAGTAWVSSEGWAARGVDPFVAEIRLDGRTLRTLELPDRFLPRDGRGVRDNLGFESLTLSPDGSSLFVATENALAQDGPAASPDSGSRARLLRFDAASGRLVAEHVYEVERVPRVPVDPDGLVVGGLVELLSLGGDRLLALERAYAQGRGNTVRLYLVDLAGADDVSGSDRLPRPGRLRPVAKRRLLDLAAFGVPVGNVEGMALGPRLADGRRLLLLVSDDNFDAAQESRLYAFAVGGEILP